MRLNKEITFLSPRPQQAVVVEPSRVGANPLVDELTITFQRQDDASYQLQASSALGEMKGQPFRAPFKNEELTLLLEQLADSGNHSMRRLRRNGPEMVMDVGMRLFYALFDGAIGTDSQQLLLQARKEGRSVRFRLVIASPELAYLPWEFLYDETRADFLGLSRYSPLIRQWGKRPSSSLAAIELPLRILVVTADVHSQIESLQEGKLLRELQAEFNHVCLVEVVENANRERFFQALNEYSYHILLFIGNGHPLSLESNQDQPTFSHAQALALMPQEGKPLKSQRTWDLLHAKELIEVLRHKKTLRLVHLNGPHTDWLARELTDAVPATIGIRGAVTETAYQAFSQAFYRALITGQPLERAVTLGRQKMDHHRAGTREWSHVVFYMQSKQGILLPSGASDASPIVFESTSTQINLPKREEWELLELHLAIHRCNLDVLNERGATYQDAIPNFLLRQQQETKEKIARLEAQMNYEL